MTVSFADFPPCQREFECEPHAADQHEADQAPVSLMQAVPNFEDAELRVGRSDADVAGERKLESSAKGVPVDRGDQGLVDAMPASRNAAADSTGDGSPRIEHRGALPPGNEGLQVGTRTKSLSRAGDYRDVHSVVGLELGPDAGQFVVELIVQRVQRLGPVERHVDKSARLFVRHSHSSPSQ